MFSDAPAVLISIACRIFGYYEGVTHVTHVIGGGWYICEESMRKRKFTKSFARWEDAIGKIAICSECGTPASLISNRIRKDRSWRAAS